MMMSEAEFDHQSRLGRLTGFVQTRMHLVRYTAFALAAIAINLLFQNAVLALSHGLWFGIYLAIAFGNASGLIFKYVCDKYWVFNDLDVSVLKNSRKFVLYSTFGVLTSILFWLVELVFHYVFGTAFMTNVGGVLGLCIGYVIKYNLDKRITFSAGVQTPKGAPPA